MIGSCGGQETTWSASPDWPLDKLHFSSKALEVCSWCKYIENKTNASFQAYASFYQDGLFFINWKFTDDLVRAATAAHLDALQRENFLQFKHSMVFKRSFSKMKKKNPKPKVCTIYMLVLAALKQWLQSFMMWWNVKPVRSFVHQPRDGVRYWMRG